MRNRFIKKRVLKLFIVASIAIFLFASCEQSDKGSISGTVLKGGKPASGTIRIINPADLSPIAENKVYQDGHFFLKDVPKGEWLIALTGRTGGAIGNYHYVKVGGIGLTADMEFDVLDEDPKATELINSVSTQKETDGSTE